jgi:hypothetical protein
MQTHPRPDHVFTVQTGCSFQEGPLIVFIWTVIPKLISNNINVLDD